MSRFTHLRSLKSGLESENKNLDDTGVNMAVNGLIEILNLAIDKDNTYQVNKDDDPSLEDPNVALKADATLAAGLGFALVSRQDPDCDGGINDVENDHEILRVATELLLKYPEQNRRGLALGLASPLQRVFM